MDKDKRKAESWDDLKKWLENIKKTEPDFKAFAVLVLHGMKDILASRQECNTYLLLTESTPHAR